MKKIWAVLDPDKAVLINTLANKRSTAISIFLESKGEPCGQKMGYVGMVGEAKKAWNKYRIDKGYTCIKVSIKFKDG